MNRLRNDLKQFEQAGSFHVDVFNTSPDGKPIIVLVYKLVGTEKKLVDYSILQKPGKARFVLEQGRYLAAAFEDSNEDMVYQTNEYAGYFGKPDILKIKPEMLFGPVNITLLHPEKITLAESPDLTSPESRVDLNLEKMSAGKVISLDDPKLSEGNGELGLWEPVTFVQKVGGGVYFLEPYDQKKIPVLFVHGSGGCPQDWTYIIENIDRQRFQPWVFSYASGLRLDDAVELLRRSLSEIALQHKPTNFAIVAHSMGGLVSRGFINYFVSKTEKKEEQILDLFITISTPWRGHKAASLGLILSPAVIPSWYDMVPASSFQRALLKNRLPEYIDSYLLFGFKGGHSLFMGNNDGTISLASQLYLEAQKEAVKVYGFDESHSSILDAKEVSQTINQILLTSYRR